MQRRGHETNRSLLVRLGGSVICDQEECLIWHTPSLPAMSLCLGYHQVTQFGPGDDYEEEEEIFYVTLELGNVEPSLISSCDSYYLVVSTFLLVELRLTLF